jgi:hypothetical protein
MSKLISQLPEDIKVVALQRQREETNDFFDKSTDKLNDAFDWGRTPEKQDIWEYVYYGNYEPFRKFHAKQKQQDNNGWISVEERLPETNGIESSYVLTINKGGHIDCMDFRCGEWYKDHILDTTKITHWQPLLPPPAKP